MIADADAAWIRTPEAAVLTCLRDAVSDAMRVVIHLDYWRPRDERNIQASGEWAFSIRREGLRFEHESEWWSGARARGEAWGWDRAPAHHITWGELTDLIGSDPRRAELTTWAATLQDRADQVRELVRPHELWPNPEQWNPGYVARDRAHPRWEQRLTAWHTLQAILTDAVTRLGYVSRPAVQLSLFEGVTP